jgi:hypothetical protein
MTKRPSKKSGSKKQTRNTTASRAKKAKTTAAFWKEVITEWQRIWKPAVALCVITFVLGAGFFLLPEQAVVTPEAKPDSLKTIASNFAPPKAPDIKNLAPDNKPSLDIPAAPLPVVPLDQRKTAKSQFYMNLQKYHQLRLSAVSSFSQYKTLHLDHICMWL